MTNYSWGDVVLVAFPQVGSSARKKRPAMVVLDTGDADVVLAPITSRPRSAMGDCQIQDLVSAGLVRPSWVRLAKLACLAKADIEKKLGLLGSADRQQIARAWSNCYSLRP